MPENIIIGLTFTAAAGAALGALEELGGSVKGMGAQTARAERQFKELGASIKQSAAGGANVKALSDQYTKLWFTLEKAKASAAGFHAATERIAGHRAAIGGMFGELMGTAGLGMTLAAPIKSAMDFETSMAEVSKVLNDVSDEKVAQLGETIKGMTRTIPVAATDLAAIAASGGQLGIAFDDLADHTDASGKRVDGFISTVAKMSIAFDMSAEETGNSMAKIKNIFGFETSEMVKVGDMINKFADSGVATARDTINSITRLGNSAKSFGPKGMSVQQVGAWGNVIASLSDNIENGTTAFNGLMTQMSLFAAGALPDKANDAMASIGISSKDMKKAIEEDANGAMVKFVETMKSVPWEKQKEVIAALTGGGDVRNLAFLFGDKGLDVYKDSMEVIAKSSGSMEAEFRKRSATTALQLQLLKNRVTELGITIGSVLLPQVRKTIESLKPLVEGVIEFSKAHPELVSNIGKAVAGFVAFRAASIGVRLVYHSLGATLGTFLLPLRGLSYVNNSIKAARGLKSMGEALTAFNTPPPIPQLGASIGSAGATASKAAGFFGRFGSALGWIGRAAVMVGGALAGISAPVWGVIVVVGAALAAVGVLVYKYWSHISHFFSGFWKGFKAGIAPLGTMFKQVFAPMAPVLKPVVGWVASLGQYIKPLGGWFAGLLTPVKDTGTGMTNLGETVGKFIGTCVAKFTEFLVFMQGLPLQFLKIGGDIIGGLVKGITGKWDEAKKAITGVGDSLKGWFSSTLGISSPSRVFMRFGGYLDEGLALGIGNSIGAVTGAVNRLSAAAVPKLPDLGGLAKGMLPSISSMAPKLPDIGSMARRMVPSIPSASSMMPALPSLSGMAAQALPNPLPNLPKLPNMRQAMNSAVHFSPTINVSGAASGAANEVAGQVRGAVEEGFEAFRKQMDRYTKEMGRRAFGGAF